MTDEPEAQPTPPFYPRVVVKLARAASNKSTLVAVILDQARACKLPSPDRVKFMRELLNLETYDDVVVYARARFTVEE